MKIIKVTTELEMTIHEFPTGTYEEQNAYLRGLIGEDCRLYEHVMPNRLYTEFHHQNRPTKVKGQCISMLIDEECLLKENMKLNLIGSYLYETDKHRNPILGNILFVGEGWSGDGIDFCGIEESVFKKLKLQLNEFIYGIKEIRGALEL